MFSNISTHCFKWIHNFWWKYLQIFFTKCLGLLNSTDILKTFSWHQTHCRFGQYHPSAISKASLTPFREAIKNVNAEGGSLSISSWDHKNINKLGMFRVLSIVHLTVLKWGKTEWRQDSRLSQTLVHAWLL